MSGKKGLKKLAQAKRQFDEAQVKRDADGRFAARSQIRTDVSTSQMLAEYKRRKLEREQAAKGAPLPSKETQKPPSKPSQVDPPPELKQTPVASKPKSQSPPKAARQQLSQGAPAIDVDSLPEGRRSAGARAWDKSWDKAPADLKAVLRVTDEPDVVKDDVAKMNTSYCDSVLDGSKPSYIHMHPINRDYTAAALVESTEAGIWRHEYGHHLEAEIGRYLGRHALSGANPPSVVGRVTRFGEHLTPEIEVGANSFGGYDDKEKGMGLVSCSRHAHQAFRQDEDRLRQRAAVSESADLATFRDEFENYKDELRREAPIALRSLGSDPNNEKWQQALGGKIRNLKQEDRLAQIRSEYDERNGLEPPESPIKFGVQPRYIARPDDREFFGRLVAQELAQTHPDSLTTKIMQAYPRVKSMEHAAQILTDPDRPETQVQLADEMLSEQKAGKWGMVSDLAGSITKNKIGSGHSDDYYGSDPGYRRNSEAFANLVSIYGSGHPLAEDIVKTFSPDGFQFMKDAFKQVIATHS